MTMSYPKESDTETTAKACQQSTRTHTVKWGRAYSGSKVGMMCPTSSPKKLREHWVHQPEQQSRCQRTVLTWASKCKGPWQRDQATTVWRQQNCDGLCVRVHERGPFGLAGRFRRLRPVIECRRRRSLMVYIGRALGLRSELFSFLFVWQSS